MFFFGANFCNLVEKKASCQRYKLRVNLFLGKNGLKSWRSLEHSGILRINPVWHLVRFGSLMSWMVTNPPIWQNWTKTTLDEMITVVGPKLQKASRSITTIPWEVGWGHYSRLHSSASGNWWTFNCLLSSFCQVCQQELAAVLIFQRTAVPAAMSFWHNHAQGYNILL